MKEKIYSYPIKFCLAIHDKIRNEGLTVLMALLKNKNDLEQLKNLKIKYPDLIITYTLENNYGGMKFFLD